MSAEDLFDEFIGEKKEKKSEKKVEPKTSSVKPTEPTPIPTEESKQLDFGGEIPLESKPSPFDKDAGITPKPEVNDFFQEATAPTPTSQEVQKPTVEEVSPPRRPTVETKKQFDFAEATGTGKEVYMIYGLKGEGKTVLSMSFPGKIAVLSFDRKSLAIKQQQYKNDERIKVYDAIRYLDSADPEMYLQSSEESFRFLNQLLDHIAQQFKPDWIVIDGSEILQRLCEMTMRYRNNIMPFQGISNRNLWKERRLYIAQIHNKSIRIANKGLIYTTYVDKQEVVKDGEFVTKQDVPRWIDVIMTETDCVIKVDSEQDKTGGRKFFATVESSKTSIKTGQKKDITGTGITAFIKEGEKK